MISKTKQPKEAHMNRMKICIRVILSVTLAQNVAGLNQLDFPSNYSTETSFAQASAGSTKQETGRFVQVNEQQKYQIVIGEPSSVELPFTSTTTTASTTTRTATSTLTANVGSCKLGDEIHSVGDKWNPDLPPHGIQVCVLCECVAHHRGSVSEPRLTCRRIAKDCPQIEACPFGEKPVASPGQCCKHCPSHNILGEGLVGPSTTIASPSHPIDDDHQQQQQQQQQQNATRAADSSVAELGKAANNSNVTTNHQKAGKPKIGGLRSNNKELNTKDSKLAFKSLESQSGFLSPAEPASKGEAADADATGEQSASICKLGNATYAIGETWSPNLPPFGLQVCILCECVARLRKSCYEAKVTCRRIANECPVIESCPDGKEPVTAPGKCCKSCPSSTLVTAATTQIVTLANMSEASNISTDQSKLASGNLSELTKEDRIKPTITHISIMDLPLCKRDGSDIVGSISKRSHGSTNKRKKKKSRTAGNKMTKDLESKLEVSKFN